MADYCKQCSINIFGKDHEDLKGIAKPHAAIGAICEGCGYTNVNHEGVCCGPCMIDHKTGDKR